MLIPHKVKNKGKYISFHYLRGWKARKIRKVQEISPQIPICKTVALIISKNHACSNLLKTRGRCVLLPLIFSNLLRTTSYGKSYLLIRITGCLTAMVSTISSTNSFMSILINKLDFLPPKFYISYGFLQQLHINWF